MAQPAENALLSFAARLRSRQRRVAVLTLFAWVLVAETLLVVHRIDHNTAGHGVTCALCSAADHLAGTAVTAIHAIDPPAPIAVAATVCLSLSVAIRFPYHSRAPPQHLTA
jgi:hypothetical protein